MMKLVLIGYSALFIMACADQPQNETDPVIPDEITQTQPISQDVSAEEFNRLMSENPGTVLDVRTEEEFGKGYIDGAVNMNFYADDFTEQIKKLDTSSPVYVYCAAGGRSGKAKKILSENGFNEVYNLSGGYKNWPYK